MPSSDPAPERLPDLSAVPAFLRDGTDVPAAVSRRSLAIPRPVTPAPEPAAPEAPTIDPAALPMPSLSRRRLVTAAGIIAASLLALSFVRQVGEATTAANRAAELRAGNAVLRDEVDRLQQDLSHVQDPRYILLAARAFGLGGPREIPFALAAGAPPLAADAPGSASVRLGAAPLHRTPLDAWLEVLFGGGS
jgi:cell division protein FtsB